MIYKGFASASQASCTNARKCFPWTLGCLAGLGALCIWFLVIIKTSPRVATKSQAETFFIDPDHRTYLQKFYSGMLIVHRPVDVTVSPSKTNVNIFKPSEEGLPSCVPYRLPYNERLKICVYPRSEDQLISSQLADQGVWEEENVRDLVNLLQSEGEASLVDVGCNIGVYTLAAASMGHRVLAIDPVASSLQLLHHSLRLANLSQHVTLLHNAVAHTRRQFAVNLQPGNMGGSSLSLQSSSGSDSVWSVCLDDLVELVASRAVVLKLDIEGWEERALRCAAAFFQQLSVRAVLMEWVFHRHTPAAPTIIHFFLRNGLLPFAHGRHHAVLPADDYPAWPDNVFWIKR